MRNSLPTTIRLFIPGAVIQHWQPKFEDLDRHGVTGASDRTYQKVREAAASGKRAYIQADTADLREIAEECASWLGDETDVSIGRDPEDRRIRSGYRKLATAANRPPPAKGRNP